MGTSALVKALVVVLLMIRSWEALLSSVVVMGPLSEWGGGQVGGGRGPLGMTCLGAVWFLCFFNSLCPRHLLCARPLVGTGGTEGHVVLSCPSGGKMVTVQGDTTWSW